MTRQEENWELMTILRLPWKEAQEIDDEDDRKFLLEKCDQIKELHQQAMREAANQQLDADSKLYTPPDNIISP